MSTPDPTSIRITTHPVPAVDVGSVRLTVCRVRWFLSVHGSVESSREGDCERVECGLPPDHPACPAPAGGVKGAGHQVQALQRGLLVGEVPAGLHGPVVPRVDGLGGVGRADHLPDLHVVGQERYEPRPRVASQLHDRRIPVPPLGGELGTPVLGCLLGRGRVHRFEGLHDRVAVLPAGVAEAVTDQVDDALLHDRVFPSRVDHLRQSLQPVTHRDHHVDDASVSSPPERSAARTGHPQHHHQPRCQGYRVPHSS